MNPRGSETSYYFQYGTTPAYGLQTPAVSAGAGDQEIKVAQPITGLQPDTTYHFRVVASSPGGTAYGTDDAFTTKKVPLAFDVFLTPVRQVFGGTISVTGTLTGSEAANRPVVLQANTFPFLAGFKSIGAAKLTDAAGGFSFAYSGLTENTQFRVATLTAPFVFSRPIAELVAVKVSLHVRKSRLPHRYLIYGDVLPPQTGAVVLLQRMRHGHRSSSAFVAVLKRGRSSAASHYSRLMYIRRPGDYRAFVSVLSGRQVSHYSRTVQIR